MTNDLDRAKNYFDLALNFINLSDFESAEKELVAANILCPNRISILVNLSFTLVNLHKWDANIRICSEILNVDSTNLDGLINLAITHHQLGQATLAKEYISRALEINPRSHSAWSNFGNIALDNKDYIKAKEYFETSIALNPQSEESYIGLGNLLNEQSEYKKAIDYFDFALSINPLNPLASWNKSLSLLRLGDFTNGWRLYESRWQIFGMKQNKKNLSTKLWLGDFPIRGQVIHIYSEQGYGDIIQMARFLPIIGTKFSAQVIFETSNPLFELCKSLSPSITIIRTNEVPISKDGLSPTFHCPIMSLPLAFKTKINSIPQDTPYLFANASKTLKWSVLFNKLPWPSKDRPPFRVGICTQGSGHYAGKPNSKRDVPGCLVNQILTACHQFSIEWHSLNLIKDSSINSSINLIDNSNDLIDFDETAALIKNLDLIISVDTAVAHLAGALGKSVIVMLPNPPDFLSGIENTRSLWYTSMEYLRQQEPGVWPIEALVKKIQLICNTHHQTKNHP